MLEDIVSRAIAFEPDFVIVDKVARLTALAPHLSSAPADVVIVRQPDDPAAASVLDALGARRIPKVIAISDDGHNGVLHELHPHRAPLGEISARTLIAAIRAAAAPPRY